MNNHRNKSYLTHNQRQELSPDKFTNSMLLSKEEAEELNKLKKPEKITNDLYYKMLDEFKIPYNCDYESIKEKLSQ